MERNMPQEVNKGYLRDLSEQECWVRLGETGIARIAVCTASEPMIVPVNYLVDAGTLVVRTAPYTQLAAHLGETVALEVDDFDPEMRRGWSVLMVGPVAAVDDPDELTAMRSQHRLQTWAPGSRNLFIRLTPVRVSGRDLR